ncbi:MAG: hypothetical protein ACI91R_001140 [Vicingaceae bacterium]|jgi:hypothetical protein
MLKKLSMSFLALFMVAFTMNAQELPQPSPYAETMQRVGLTDVTVQYSRPGVKDRLIFGDLEPFGSVWRTGANSATKIVLSTDAMIGEKEIMAGTYSVLSTPMEEGNWKVYLNSDLDVQENSYKAENNVVEIEVKTMKISEKVESMTFWFANVKDESVDLMFAWENTSWILPIKVAAKELAVKNIEAKISEVESAYSLYNNSAKYYLTNKIDLNKALAWSTKSVEISEKFWNVYTLSTIQYELGMTKEALKTATKSLELSTVAKYQPYIKMNTENIAKWSKK